jgi:serine phosphatase RsbU (regulator of sigma subunit)
MNSILEHTNGRAEVAMRAYKKWMERGRADEIRDWLDAEVEIVQLHDSMRRIAELEEQAEAGKRAQCQLTDVEAWLAHLVADARQAAQRLAAEHAVSRLLAESAQFTDAAPGILQAICESLDWDFGAFWLLDRGADALTCIDVWHTPVLQLRAFEHDNRRRRFSAGVGLPGRVWASDRPAWICDVTQDTDFPRAAIADAHGLHAAVAFPIHNSSDFLGVMEFFSREIRQPDQVLLEMMVSIGDNISQFIERRRGERLLQQEANERSVARQIQQGLLPKTIPAPAGFSIGGRSVPSHMVGGDYFDFFAITEERLGIAIGDASGHGIGPALMICETRAYVRALGLTSTDLGAILRLTNRRLTEDLEIGPFVTLFLARLDPGTRRLAYAGAGHCPGCLLDRAGNTKTVLYGEGLPLGVDPASDFPVSGEIILEPGELLFLYTDGITEACSSSASEFFFGIDRAVNIVQAHHLQSPAMILDALFQAVSDFAQPRGQVDDATAVIVKVEDPA